jgi:hypothetical protein
MAKLLRCDDTGGNNKYDRLREIASKGVFALGNQHSMLTELRLQPPLRGRATRRAQQREPSVRLNQHD